MPGAFCQCIDQSSAQLVPTRLKQSKILTETCHCLIGGGVCSDVKKTTVNVFFLKKTEAFWTGNAGFCKVTRRFSFLRGVLDEPISNTCPAAWLCSGPAMPPAYNILHGSWNNLQQPWRRANCIDWLIDWQTGRGAGCSDVGELIEVQIWYSRRRLN